MVSNPPDDMPRVTPCLCDEIVDEDPEGHHGFFAPHVKDIEV